MEGTSQGEHTVDLVWVICSEALRPVVLPVSLDLFTWPLCRLPSSSAYAQPPAVEGKLLKVGILISPRYSPGSSA